ncbi:hypothetical protein AGMMS49950_09740 [Endomicrobiia bacterium]|nr:hypothetical protein AGMMS49950_09740 [Endomicrobiia bacterium]
MGIDLRSYDKRKLREKVCADINYLKKNDYIEAKGVNLTPHMYREFKVLVKNGPRR